MPPSRPHSGQPIFPGAVGDLYVAENRPPAVTMVVRPDMGVGVGSGAEHVDRYRSVYVGEFAAMMAYAVRRVEQPEDAADVVAETFLVAWRRRHEMPAGRRGPAVALRRRPPGAGQPPPRRSAPTRSWVSGCARDRRRGRRRPGQRGAFSARRPGRPGAARRARPGSPHADRLGRAGAARGGHGPAGEPGRGPHPPVPRPGAARETSSVTISPRPDMYSTTGRTSTSGGQMTDPQLDRLVRDADPYRPEAVGRVGAAKQTLLEEIMSEPGHDHAPRWRVWSRSVRVRRVAGALAAAALSPVSSPCLPCFAASPDEHPACGAAGLPAGRAAGRRGQPAAAHRRARLEGDPRVRLRRARRARSRSTTAGDSWR